MKPVSLNQHLALEMAMQDVMDNMEELALGFGYAAGESCFEILAIEPTDVPNAVTAPPLNTTVRSPYTADVQPLSHSYHVA